MLKKQKNRSNYLDREAEIKTGKGGFLGWIWTLTFSKRAVALTREAKLGTWVSFRQLSECQGQGRDARPGHLGMRGEAP